MISFFFLVNIKVYNKKKEIFNERLGIFKIESYLFDHFAYLLC